MNASADCRSKPPEAAARQDRLRAAPKLRRIAGSAILGFVALTAFTGRAVERDGAEARAFTSLADTALYFEANQGQIDSSCPYVARGQECTVQISPTEAVLVLGKCREPATASRW